MKLMGRSALDPRWTRHHTPVAADFMLATVKVVRKLPSTEAATPVYDPATRTWSTESFQTVISNVKARIQPYGITGDMVVGQDTTGRRLMRVQIEDVNTGVQVDDIVMVTACDAYPDLMNFSHEVRSAVSSSNAWLTDLVCEMDVKGR